MTYFFEYAGARFPRLSDAQRTVCALVDKVVLPAAPILGGLDEAAVPSAAWRTLILCAGRRSGKSIILALHALWSSETVDRSGLAPGETAVYAVVAPTLRQARQVLDLAAGFGAERLSADECTYRGVSIRAVACGRGGGAVRGFSLVGAGCDESAFFQADDGVLNLADVHRAILPALLPGAGSILSSSPWGKVGYFYDEFDRNWEHPRTAIAVRADTLTMREGDRNIEELVRLAYAQDPASADREYGASFDSASERCFFDGALIDQALTRGKPATLPIVVAGADLAQTNDSSALVILGDGPHGAAPLAIDVFTPSPGKPLRLTEVVPAFCATAASRGCFRIFADHWALEVARELATNGIQWHAIPGGNGGKLECFTRLREVLPDLAISPPHRLLADQMRVCTSAPLPGGGIAIRSPRVKGAHGDVLSAAAAAASQLGSVRQYMSGPFNPAAIETLLAGMMGGCEHRSLFGRWFS